MVSILGISGSLRAASHNTRLLEAAQQLAPDGVTIDIYNRLREIPPYDHDADGASPPEVVQDLRNRIRLADGVIVATPEYNYSIPGVLKNALDWASTAPDGALVAKPVAIIGAAPTNFGSVRAQLALRQVFLWTDSRVMGKPELIVFRSHERFDADGRLSDADTKDLLSQVLSDFGSFCAEGLNEVSV